MRPKNPKSIKSWQDAMDCIASVYVFDEKQFPSMAYMADEKIDKLIFSIGHNLLHMQKALAEIATANDNFGTHIYDATKHRGDSTLKIILACLSIGGLLELTADDFVDSREEKTDLLEYLKAAQVDLGRIASEIEQYQHGKGFSQLKVSDAVTHLLCCSLNFFAITNFAKKDREIFRIISAMRSVEAA